MRLKYDPAGRQQPQQLSFSWNECSLYGSVSRLPTVANWVKPKPPHLRVIYSPHESNCNIQGLSENKYVN